MFMEGMKVSIKEEEGIVYVSEGALHVHDESHDFDEIMFNLNLDDLVLYDLYIVKSEDTGEYEYHLDETFLEEVETPSYSGGDKLIHRLLTVEIDEGEILEENIHHLD